MVGHLPEPHHLAAVAAGSAAFNVIHFAFVFLRMGTTGLVAQAFGRRDDGGIRDVLLLGGILALGVAVLVIALGPALVPAASRLFATGDQADPALRTYLWVRLLGLPASLLTLVVLGWLLGLQNARGPMLLMIVTNTVNVVLDVVLVVGAGMGAAGVAAATVVAEHAGLALAVLLVRRELRHRGGAFAPLGVLLRSGGFGRMLRVNRDIFVRSAALQVGFLSFAVIGARQGEITLAANAVLLNLQTLAAFGLDGFAHAAEAAVGRAVGARDREGFRRAVRAAGEFAIGLSLALSALFLLGGTGIVAAMTTIPEVRETAGRFLLYMVVSPPLSVWAFLFDGIFIGATRTAVMRDGMIVACLVFLASALLLVPPLGNHGLWLAFLLFMGARGLWLGVAYLWIEGRADGFVGARG